MSKPDFFIIGSPKCGTTSMAAWLSEHPNIFVSRPKEPHFFNTDMNFREITDLDSYLRLFRNVSDKCCAVGEASTFYLFSQDAVSNILQFQPDARFIVMLRNPIEAAQSLHTQMRYDDMEPIESFEQAWNSSVNNRPIGLRCTDPKVLQYREVVSYGSQVDRLLRQVDSSRVMFIFMEDLKNDSLHEYSRTLDFIGVPSDGRADFPTHNQSKIYRSKWVNHLRTLLARSSRSWLPEALRKWLLKFNYRAYRPEPLRPEFAVQIKDQLRDDIKLLSILTKRDLSGWFR